MKKLILIKRILLLLLIAYLSQGVLYGKGSIISQVLLIVIFLISIYFFIKLFLLNTRENLFFKAFSGLMLLNFFGLIFTGDVNNSTHFNQLKGILLVALPFYPFYYLTKKKILTENDLIYFFLIMLPMTIAKFYIYRNEALLLKSGDESNFVNNIAYTFAFFIPFTFLFKKKLFSILSIVILLIFIIQGAKRGALVTGVLSSLILMYYQLKNIEKKNRIKSYILTFVGFIIMTTYFYDFYMSNQFLIERMESLSEEGGVSGRDVIYTNLINSWYNSESIINTLFGYGFASTLQLSGRGLFAHNDWIELLVNFGVLGVIVYLLMFYSASLFVLNKYNNRRNRLMMISIILIWFFTTLFSMNYTSSNGIYQSILLAFLLAKNVKTPPKINYKNKIWKMTKK